MESPSFLLEVSLADDDGAPDEPSPAQDTPDSDGEWDPNDFPSWYRDKVAPAENESDDDELGALEPNDGESNGKKSNDEPTNYPFGLAAVQTLDRLKFAPITVLVGDNGSGKSTIVEAIAVAAGFNPEGGSRNLNFATHDTHSALHERLVLRWEMRPRWGWFLRAETFYGMASHITEDDDPSGGVAHIFPDLHNRSHGESFLTLAESRFTGRGLYLFDEPESALSIQGLMRLSALINQSMARGSQFIISTHSPLLMALPGATIYELDADSGIEQLAFDDMTSTVLWRRFFDDPLSFHQTLA